MYEDLTIRQFNNSSLNSVLDFCAQNVVSRDFSRTLITRFLAQLTSTDRFIFDIHRGSTRVAVAVLIDKIENPSHSANLEIVGRDKSVDPADLFQLIFSNLPTGQAIQVGTYETLNPPTDILEKFGFGVLYHTYKMSKPDMSAPVKIPQEQIKFALLSLEQFEEYYDVLVKSFSANPETSIPPIDEMRESFRRRTQDRPSGTTLLLASEKIVGFYSVVRDEIDSRSGEVHMIGVLPDKRGKGLGAVALSKAIRQLALLGCEHCHLTVAAQNSSALDLYKRFGFEIENVDTAYLRK